MLGCTSKPIKLGPGSVRPGACQVIQQAGLHPAPAFRQHSRSLKQHAGLSAVETCRPLSALRTGCMAHAKQQQQQQARRVQARVSSLSMPDAAGDSSGNVQPAAPVTRAGSTLDPQVVSDWLLQHVPFKLLSRASVRLLAELMEVEQVPAGKLLGREGLKPQDVVVLRQGSVRITGSNMPAPVEAGPGASFFLVELLLGHVTNTTVRASSDCVLWVVRGTAVLRLAASRPDFVLELGLKMSQEMAAQVGQLEADIQSEERRNRAMQPYRVTTPRRGIIGNSTYADRLRRQILSAARDPTRRSVLIFGEPGLCKDNIAALLHFGGPDKFKPMVQVDVTEMDPFMTELFGRGSREGLLHWVKDGTVAINNVHKAAPHMVPQLRQLLEHGVYQPAPAPVPLGSIDLPAAARQSSARIILTAAQRVRAFDGLTTVIQVPPLRVRPADIIDLERYFMRVLSKQRGVRLTLTGEAERQLVAYTFPNNIVELEGMVQRAAAQTGPEGAEAAPKRSDATRYTGISRSLSGTLALDKDVFWFAAQGKDRFRWNMLNSLPLLRQFLRSDVFPELINHKIVKPVFAVVVALLFIGPQDRAHNFCLSLFWNYWWPIMFIIYPFLGRIWCSICPFMIYGEVMQRWRTASGVVLRKWPREELERWGGWFLFALFAAILVWEEVWDLPDTAYLSSWLLLLITAGAVVCSAFFERRLWCRYLCPIGGMNGLFAKLSMTELRARQGVCSGTCNTYHCYKGGPAEAPEGLETLGCPVYSHPAQLTDNRNCVLCMTCLKACPHRSIEVRLRLPGVDLWTSHKPAWYEVMLQFMLLGAVYLHRVPELEAQFGVDPALLSHNLPHILASIGIMAVPGLMAWGSDAVMRLAFEHKPLPAVAAATTAEAAAAVPAPARGPRKSPRGGMGAANGMALAATATVAAAAGTTTTAATTAAATKPIVPFLSLSYGYLPLVWAATLAHYLPNFLEEAGLILPVTAATFGLNGAGLPSFVADHAVTEFLQGVSLLAGAGLSLLMTRKVGSQPWVVLTPQCLTILGFTAELWYLNVR